MAEVSGVDLLAAKDAYEGADDAWAALKPVKQTPGALVAHHARMATLAAACRDAATTEQDRCRWDIRWHGHFVAGGKAPMPAVKSPKPVKRALQQSSLF